MNVIIETIPASLKKLPQWLVWRSENRNGKPTKVPYSVRGGPGKSNDPSTWSPFDETVKFYSNGGNYSGIGFCLDKNDRLAGIDLDHVIDATGTLNEAGREIVDRFQGSYCEISPSGTGIRIFAYGTPPRAGKNIGKVKWAEVYDHTSPRYLTVTGHHFEGTETEITAQQDAIDWLHEKYFKQPEKPKAKPRTGTPGQCTPIR